MAVLMELVSISPSLIEGYYDLLLLEVGGKRALSIPVGEHEGQNIALSIDKVSISRPLTFDLFCNILSKSNVETKYIIINKFLDGTYFSNVCCEINNEQISFDARTSDAINLAIKLSLSIFVSEKVLDEVSVEIQSPDIESIEEEWSVEELEQMLVEAEQNEDKEIIEILKEKINELKNSN